MMFWNQIEFSFVSKPKKFYLRKVIYDLMRNETKIYLPSAFRYQKQEEYPKNDKWKLD